MKKVIFLDRDGVINREIGDYVYELSSFVFNEGLKKALLNWSDKGYSFAIITNQGGISKSRYTKSHVYKINKFLTDWFELHQLTLLSISFCPHHDGAKLPFLKGKATPLLPGIKPKLCSFFDRYAGELRRRKPDIA